MFTGFDQSQYVQTGRIPDGQYRIGFRVVGAIVGVDTDGNETKLESSDTNADGITAITDSKGNSWMVDSGGNVSHGGSDSGIEDVVSDTEAGKDKGYYIIADSDTTKYKTGDELVYIKHKRKVKLTLGSEKDTLKVADLKWKIDDKEACKVKYEFKD